MMVWRSLTAGWIVRRDLRNKFLAAGLGVFVGSESERGHLTGVEIHLLGRSDRIAVIILKAHLNLRLSMRKAQHGHARAVPRRRRRSIGRRANRPATC